MIKDFLKSVIKKERKCQYIFGKPVKDNFFRGTSEK